MPEKEICRRCGGCCGGCIFLRYNKDTEHFSCLIYRNKGRVPLRTSDLSIDAHLWFTRLIIIAESRGGICDGFDCDRDDVSAPYIPSEYYTGVAQKNLHSVLIEIHGIEEWVKANIPDFETLVEILNAKVNICLK
jgi:hypothetical protein